MKTFLQKIKLIIPAATVLIVPASAKAAITSGDVEGWGLGMFTRGTLSEVIARVISIVLVLAGVAAVGYLIAGGISYLSAGGDAEKAGAGKTTIVHAIIGIVIILSAWMIFDFVLNKLGLTWSEPF